MVTIKEPTVEELTKPQAIADGIASRAYRDVRAGAFMYPLGVNRAYEFIGRVALGLEPSMA